MIKITVTNSKTNRSFMPTFSTLEEGQTWLDERIASGFFGQPAREIVALSEEYTEDDVQSTRTENEVDYVTLKGYSYTTEDTTDQVAQQERIETLRREGERAKGCCDEVLNVVRGYNLTLTEEQVNTISSTFSSIFSLLSAGHPNRSKTAITAITPDELVTQELKDDILAVFTRWGF